jgi:DNA-binding transcriptional MerR regulator
LKCGRNAHFSLTELKRRLKMESKTPRTDEQLKFEAFFDGIGIVETVEVEFAQQLETELADKDRQLAEARAEIEKNSKLIERMKNCQNCGRTGGFCRHCRYAPDKRGWDDNWKEPI